MNFSYLWKFLFKISSKGPKSLLKLCLFSPTTDKSVCESSLKTFLFKYFLPQRLYLQLLEYLLAKLILQNSLQVYNDIHSLEDFRPSKPLMQQLLLLQQRKMYLLFLPFEIKSHQIKKNIYIFKNKTII